jgi:hypothetical protein
VSGLARESGLPGTINFSQAIKNRKPSLCGSSKSKKSQPASDHKFIEHFLPITRGLPNIKECQFITDIFFVGFVGFSGGGHRSLRRMCIHADQLM